MKIKYIGNFTDGTGWARAATYKALALKNIGHDIYCEEFKYNDSNVVIEDEINDLLYKKSDNFDVVIQHVLPNNYRYHINSKNIAVFELDTLNMSNIFWIKKLNTMDEIWVPNTGSKTALEISGVKPKIKIVPHLFNFKKISSFDKIANIEELNNTFNFVFVGEFSKHKNIEAILRAFHNEFDYMEPVNLYIKTDKDSNIITGFCNEVRSRLKRSGKYKKEIFINSFMTDQILWSTIKQCHCFLMPSYGEAWCYPAMEAYALGLEIMHTDNDGSGISEYAKSSIKVKSYVQPCYGSNESVEGLHTSLDYWNEIDILDLQRKMRNVFIDFITNKKQITPKDMSHYDYRNTKILEGLL